MKEPEKDELTENEKSQKRYGLGLMKFKRVRT